MCVATLASELMEDGPTVTRQLRRTIETGVLVVLLLAVAVAGFMSSRRAQSASPPTIGIGVGGWAADRQVAVAQPDSSALVTLPAHTHRGFRNDPATVSEPTAARPQSKLWFHDGAWWGVLLEPISSEWRIHQLDWASQTWTDTGTLVDERPDAVADVLWDGAHLYIVSAGSRPSPRHHARVLRYSYDPPGRRYAADLDFPVTVTSLGVEYATLAKDTTGRLWLTYVEGGRLYVQATIGNEALWGPRTTPSWVAPASFVGQAVVIAFGSQVAVVWTSSDDTVHVARHADGAPDDAWAVTSTEVYGLQDVDEHLSVAATSAPNDARLYVAVTTALGDAVNGNPLAPQVLLLTLDQQDTWGSYLFGRVKDRHSEPLVLIDEGRNALYLIATTALEERNAIYYKQTPLDAISFDTGQGIPLIVGDSDPDIGAPTATKQVVDADSAVVVLAADGVTGHYLHGVLGQRDPTAATVSVSAPATGGVLVQDSFNPWPIGGPVTNGWAARSSDPAASLTIVARPSESDRSAQVSGVGVRACKLFAPVSTGLVSAQADVLLDRLPPSDITILSILGEDDFGVVRVERRGFFRYATASGQISTGAIFRPGVWYRAAMTVDLGAGTYSWEVRARDSGAVVAGVSGVPGPATVPSPAERICVRTATSPGAPSLYVDNVNVSR
jgi:hypothetical protein